MFRRDDYSDDKEDEWGGLTRYHILDGQWLHGGDVHEISGHFACRKSSSSCTLQDCSLVGGACSRISEE